MSCLKHAENHGFFSRETEVGRLEALKGRLLFSVQVRKGYTGCTSLHSLLHAEVVNPHIRIKHALNATDLVFSFHK